MKTFIRGSLLLSLAGVAVSAHVSANIVGQEIDDTVLRVNTRLVLVDVLVRDDDGPVPDLTEDDFTLFDDGVNQPISVFNITRSEAEPVAANPPPEGVVSNRYDSEGRRPTNATAILVDRLNTDPFDQTFANHQLKEFLATLGDTDRVAVYELTNELHILHDYMDDTALARRAVDGVSAGQTLGLAGSEDALNVGQGDRRLEALINGTNSADAEFEDLIERTFLDVRADTTAAALEAIVLHLASLPGRKNLVWLSGSFPFSFEPYRHNAFNFVIPNSTMDRLERTGRMITDANIAVYPIYAPGLGPGLGLERAGLELMYDLADRTGGQVSYNTNGLATSMRRAVDDARITYTLGFYVNDDALDTDFHRLEVRLNRPDLDVRYRQGYYGFGASRPTEVSQGWLELLASPTEANSLGLLGSISPVEGIANAYDLVLLADFADLGLGYDGESWSGSVQVATYFEPSGGETLMLPLWNLPIRMTDEELANSEQGGFPILRRLQTEGLTGWLRVVVLDPGTGNAGSLRIRVGPR